VASVFELTRLLVYLGSHFTTLLLPNTDHTWT
jgi:hypothetical protein